MNEAVKPAGPQLEALSPLTRKILVEDCCVFADIGFHDFEVGQPQRLFITVEVWLDEASVARSDDAAEAWDYDLLHSEVGALAVARRYNLQETLVRTIYNFVATLRGVTNLRVATSKPDAYPDCAGVGVELASF